MKRALIVLLLLAVAGGLFAQTLTWSGHVQSGIQVVIPAEGDPTVAWHNWDNGNNYRLRIGASYTSADGKAGAAGWLQTQNGGFEVEQGRAWVYPLDILRLQIGRGGPGGFGTLGSFDDGRGAGDVNGLSAILTPALDSATFSVGASVAPSNATFDNTRYTFGVAFGLPSLLNVRANLNYQGAENDGDGRADAGFGIGVLALNAASGTGLTRLAIDVRADNLTKDLDWIGIGPAVGFRVAGVGAGNLTTTLQARIFIPLNDKNDLDYAVGLGVEVPITGATTFGLDVGYEGATSGLPGKNGTTGGINARGWDPLPKSIGGDDPALNIRPWLSFGIGGASLQTGWAVQTYLADEVQVQHGIYLNLGVNF
jgi:opacity protein-like surface antigen